MGKETDLEQQNALKDYCNVTTLKKVIDEYIQECTTQIITLLNGNGVEKQADWNPTGMLPQKIKTTTGKEPFTSM